MGSIIVSGEGGQGVRVISHTLAAVLGDLGYEVSLLYDYDSAVRGAMSVAYLTYSKERIQNPVVQEADILLQLSNKAQGLTARKTLCESGLCTEEVIPFSQLGIDVFGKEIFGSMIAVGRLLRLIGVEASDEELSKVLPVQYRQENLSAVHFGYNLKEEDLQRGRLSTTRPEEYEYAKPRWDQGRPVEQK